MTSESCVRLMPKYRCYKEVWALKIKSVTMRDGVLLLHPEDEHYDPFEVSYQYKITHSPKAGGYYIAYRDGYESFSSAEAFEKEYTRIEQ